MSHYFKYDPGLKNDERGLPVTVLGHDFIFKTNAGMFSREAADRASLLLIENVPRVSGKLLDLGCGYGLIGVALAKAYGAPLTMSDVNPRALEYAAINAKQNGVAAEIILSDGFENINGKFDCVVTNPPIHAGKNVTFHMYAEARGRLAPGGSFYAVIQKKHGAESAFARLSEIYGTCEIIYKKKGYFIFRCGV